MIITNSLVDSIITATTTIIATAITISENRIVTGERAMRVGMVRNTTQEIGIIVLTIERDHLVDMIPGMMEQEVQYYY